MGRASQIALVMISSTFWASGAFAQQVQVIGGNPLVSGPGTDVATPAFFVDMNGPVGSPYEGVPMASIISSFSIMARPLDSGGVGQLQLKVFEPGYPSSTYPWIFAGESPIETVSTWGQVNTWTLPTPIYCDQYAYVTWWYPNGTIPSVVYNDGGSTLTNSSSSSTSDLDFESTIPDLVNFPTSFGTTWATEPRTYSISVSGKVIDLLAGDLNNDGVVDAEDLAILLSNFGDTGLSVPIDYSMGDITGDGVINADDLAVLLSDYGDSTPPGGYGPPGSVPEPILVVLPVLGAALVTRRRRKVE